MQRPTFYFNTSLADWLPTLASSHANDAQYEWICEEIVVGGEAGEEAKKAQLSRFAVHLLAALQHVGLRTVADLALTDFSGSSGSNKQTSSSVAEAANAFLAHWLADEKSKAADSGDDVEDVDMQDAQPSEDARQPILQQRELLNEFLKRACQLQDAALSAVSPPLLTGADLLKEESRNLPEQAIQQPGYTLPTEISQLVMTGYESISTISQPDHPNNNTHLCAPNEIIQISGTRGSGRKTLLLNSLILSLYANTGVHALWIGVPSLSPPADSDTDGAGRRGADEKVMRSREKDSRKHIAVKAMKIWNTIQARARAHTSTESDDKGLANTLEGESDPLDRLVIESCTSIESILALLEAIYGPPRNPQTSTATASDSPPNPKKPNVTLLVIDQVHRLFFDEDRIAPLPGLTDTVIQARLHTLTRTLVQYARSRNVRIHLINGAMASPSQLTQSSFGATANRPTLGGDRFFGYMLDATLWVTRGASIFPFIPPAAAGATQQTQARTLAPTSTSKTALGYTATLRDTRQSRDAADQRLAADVKAQGEGIQTHVLEVLESSRGGKGRWTTYSSDGIILLPSPAITSM